MRPGKGRSQTDSAGTEEHIFPVASLHRVAMSGHLKFAEWRTLNKVPACRGCNNYKGMIEPLDWLVIMPSNKGAKRLAERLVKLGVPMADVYAALNRRKR
jgi:hypothetical protein